MGTAKRSFFIHIFKRCWLPFAILIILIAIFSSIFRALTPWAIQYKPKIEKRLTKLLGEPVTIQSMETGWYWFEPVIKLNQVRVLNKNGHTLQLEKLFVGFNLLSSLWHWQIKPGLLYIDNIKVTLRQKDNHWQIEGLIQNDSFQSTSDKLLLAWVLTQQKIILKNIAAQVYFQNGVFTPIKQLNLEVVNNNSHFKIKGNIQLDQKNPTFLQLLAKMDIPSFDFSTAKGHFFLAIDKLKLPQWRSFFPASNFSLQQGTANGQIWINLNQGVIETLQSQFTVKNIIWQDKLEKNTHTLPFFAANIAWNKSAQGWRFLADNVIMVAEKNKWPQNNFALQYQANTDTYFGYARHLFLKSLFELLPSSLKKPYPILTKGLPEGHLDNTQFQIKEGKLDYLLARFNKLGWQAYDQIPRVKNLSGALYWQPLEGRLELDGQNTILQFPFTSPILFKEINGAWNWKELSHGLRINMEHFILNHPDLVVSAQGNIDEVTTHSAGQIHLNTQIVAKNVQNWLAYLPSNSFKPKLNQWFKENIKKIDQLVTEITVNGLAEDFPFDQKPGEFLIKGYIQGMNTIFAPNWPLATDLEGYLNLNKRDLDITLTHANLEGNIITKANIAIPHIGLGQENLLVHTQLKPEAEQALRYVLKSPLKKKLALLEALTLQGPIALDLQMEIPLYHKKNTVLGEIRFKHNKLAFNSIFPDLYFDELEGVTQFNEDGITINHFNTRFLDSPLEFFIQTLKPPVSAMQITLTGKAPIDQLKKRFNSPLFSPFQGNFNLESTIIIPIDLKEANHIKITSSLEGLNIDLPKPLGKTSQVLTPTTADFDFTSKAIRLHIDYNHQSISDFDYQKVNNQFKFTNGTIRFENQEKMNGRLDYNQATHSLHGTFSRVDWEKNTMPRKFKHDSSLLLSPRDMPNLNLTINALKFNGVELGSVNIQATNTKNVWQINHAKIFTPYYKISAQGQWQQSHKKSRTILNGNININNLAKALEIWKIHPAIKAQRGLVQFELAWPGAFYDFSLTELSGNAAFSLKNGRITNLSPETEEKIGLGKLLSILSLQTIPRRVMLDFSDLANSGYTFDEILGNFSIKKGLMTTQNSTINGPIAYITMKGNLNIAKQLYDLELVVFPHVTASLPIVATIAGGPIAGLATWAVSKILYESMQQISGYTYKISGPWAQPIVQEVNFIKKAKGS